MKYDIRDKTGKFTKVRRIEPFIHMEHSMTIDNATQEVTTAHEEAAQEGHSLPVVQEEESVIRTKFQSLMDAVVGASKFASNLSHLEERINALTTALENAEQRVREANTARDAALETAAKATADAHMARLAYDQVNAKMVDLIKERDDHKANEHAANLELERGSHTTTKNLLEVARTERDSFRDEVEKLRDKLETATKEFTSYTDDLHVQLSNLRKENDGLHHKCNALEDDRKSCNDRVAELRGKLDAIKQQIFG